MLLKNKKTGEIRDFIIKKDKIQTVSSIGGWEYTSLANLCKDWEDYEEPSKTIWQIKDSGELQDFEEDDFSDGYMESSKSIGNYFDTREEAEKAVEKLKAWKRLEDKGFRFDGKEVFSEGLLEIDGVLPALKGADNAERLKIIGDLDLLFGGEE